MVTRPTPGIWENLLGQPGSAMSSTWDRAMDFEVSASVRMGASAGLDLL